MFYKRIRAWHKKMKTMFKVIAIDFEKETVELQLFMLTETVKRNVTATLDEIVIMQESGLKDEDSWNVFEADIIRFEDKLFVLMYGDYGDTVTGVNGFGWHLAGEQYTFVYVGGGEKVGNSFENPELIEA